MRSKRRAPGLHMRHIFTRGPGLLALIVSLGLTPTESTAAPRARRGEQPARDARADNDVSSVTVEAPGADAARELVEALPESALPALPEVPRVELTQPTAEELQELNAKLEGLFSSDPDLRETTVTALVEVEPRTVPAARQRLLQLAEHADKERMKRYYSDARRETLNKQQSSASESQANVLRSLLASPHPKEQAWRDSVTLAALLRILSAAGTVEAARELIAAYAKFGEFARVDVQQRLLDMKDRAVAALIEARRHPAEKIARWAALRLDQMGRAIPSEAVRTTDYEALTEIIRAYGKTRDPDAARIVISFANSERTQLRGAARQAIVMLGSVGLWQLRDAYEDVVGKRPRRDWNWERTARELFGEYDRLRLARVYGTFLEGQKHLEKGDLEKMGEAFDQVLAKDPLFEKRAQMADGYFKLAQYRKEADPSAALQALLRVQRLSTDASLVKRAQSLILAIRAEQAMEHGVADYDRFKAALELDPGNAIAKRGIRDLAPHQKASAQSPLRWIASGIIALAGTLAVVLIGLRRPKKAPAADSSAAEPGPSN